MKKFLALALISMNALATSWYHMEIGQEFELRQNFQLPQKERSRSTIDFMKGERVLLKEITPLDMIKVTLFHFNYENCPGPQMTSDMEIIPVQGTSPVVEVGAQLEKNCELQIFIESKDLMTQSIFE